MKNAPCLLWLEHIGTNQTGACLCEQAQFFRISLISPNPFFCPYTIMQNREGSALLSLAAQVAEEVELDESLRPEALDDDLGSSEDEEEEKSHILAMLKPLNQIDANRTSALLTNFTFAELLQLWKEGELAMTLAWQGRGKPSKVSPFDAFFLLLYHYKHAKDAQTLAKEFQQMWHSDSLSRSAVRTLWHFHPFFLLTCIWVNPRSYVRSPKPRLSSILYGKSVLFGFTRRQSKYKQDGPVPITQTSASFLTAPSNSVFGQQLAWVHFLPYFFGFGVISLVLTHL
jgi:hypothetical protein